MLANTWPRLLHDDLSQSLKFEFDRSKQLSKLRLHKSRRRLVCSCNTSVESVALHNLYSTEQTIEHKCAFSPLPPAHATLSTQSRFDQSARQRPYHLSSRETVADLRRWCLGRLYGEGNTSKLAKTLNGLKQIKKLPCLILLKIEMAPQGGIH